jgi:hypothetical protein
LPSVSSTSSPSSGVRIPAMRMPRASVDCAALSPDSAAEKMARAAYSSGCPDVPSSDGPGM